MSGVFDPYYTWLGIPPAEQPPHYYRLLGLAPLEGNPGVVDHAAERVLMHLRSMAGGPHAAHSQRIIGEVTAARICLLDAAQKAQYDSALRSRMVVGTMPLQPQMVATPVATATNAVAATAPAKPAVPARPVVANPLPTAPLAKPQPPYAAPAVPMQIPQPIPASVPVPVLMSAQAPQPVYAQPVGMQPPVHRQLAVPSAVEAAGAASRRPVPRRKGSDSGVSAPAAAMNIVKVVLGGLGGLSMALLIVWIGFRADPLGLFQPSGGKGAVKKPSKTIVTVVERPTVRPSVVSVTQTPTTTTSDPASGNSSSTTHAQPPNHKVGVDPHPSPPVPATPVAPHSVNPVLPTAVVRQPTPTAAEQQTKLAELKEVYENEFEAANRLGTRETFPDFLLDTADRLKTDHVARFVLYREAFTRLVAFKQFDMAAEIVDRLDQEFEMDPFTLRTHTLTKASEAAKLPAEKLGIVLCAAELAEVALQRQRISEATALIRMADGHSRGLADGQLKGRVGALRAEIESAAEQWGPVERARQTLAASPDDAAAAAIDGRYRCLVLGDWETGLPLLARSSDQALGPAAKQDLTGPGGDISAAAIGDNWFVIGSADDKLAGCKARAGHWYRQTVDTATGLDKVRLEQRLKAIAELNLPERLAEGATSAANDSLPPFAVMFSRTAKFEPVSLFQFVQQAELLKSPWNYDRSSTAQNPAIYSDPRAAYGRVPSHFNPPREYQMSLEAIRSYGASRNSREAVTGPLVIGLIGPKSQFGVVLDFPLGGQYVSMFAVKDSKTETDNPTVQRHASPLVRTGSGPGVGSTVICQVRRDSVTVSVDGQQACSYKGDLSRLVLSRDWSVNDDRAFIVGAHLAGFYVKQWRLDPLPRDAPAAAEFTNPGFGPPGTALPPGLTPPGTPLPRQPGLAPLSE